MCWLLVGITADAALAEQPLPRVTAFAVADTDGNRQTLESWRAHRAVVVVFLGTECPVSNGYAPEFERLHQRFATDGVAFYGVYCEPGVTAEGARKHAAEYRLAFPLLLDPEQQLAATIGARTMPEVAVVSSDGKVLYRGRIDNRYTAKGERRVEATTHELRDAIQAVLEGKSPEPAVTQPFGCPLPRRRPARE
jgi:peroxiredoxin